MSDSQGTDVSKEKCNDELGSAVSLDIKDKCEVIDEHNDAEPVSQDAGNVSTAIPVAKLIKKSSHISSPAVVKPSKASFIRANLKHLGLRRSSFKVSEDDGEQEEKRSCGAIIILAALLFLFLVSFVGFVVMWFTNFYNNTIFEKLVLSNGSQAVKWWQTPPVDPYLRVYIFNYTNSERWMKGLDYKLKVEELGPYVYKEKFEKVQVRYNNNFTISYKEYRTYEFLPEESNGRQYDKIVFPNVVLMTVASKLNTYSHLTKISLNFFVTNANHPAFMEAAAHEVIWGYEDKLFNLVRGFTSFKSDKFGMLVTRQGVSEDSITIYTGEDDIDKLSVINRFNGEKKMNFWATDECNRIDGTDGSQFPPYYMDKKRPLDIFSKAFCRKFPLFYDSEVNILDGIPAWRYKAPLNVFASPEKNPSNQCFCNLKSGLCPPDGVFDVSKCFDAPIMLSFPHFFTGENLLFDRLEGLNPNEEKHRSYADVHPRLAFPIGGASRVQINVQVANKDNTIPELRYFNSSQILPIIWMEIVSGQISAELRSTIYHSTFSTNAIQISLNYGTLLLCATSLAMIVLIFLCSHQQREDSVASGEKSNAADIEGNVAYNVSEATVKVNQELEAHNEDAAAAYRAHPHQMLAQQMADGEQY